MNPLTQLEEWLRRGLYSLDVLCPVRPGEKCPMFPHRNGEWTWHVYDAWCQHNNHSANHSACLILRRICVIDVDDLALAKELEERFPILQQVPTALTKRGKHYWFARSETADKHGYYDKAGQRRKGIDFKSVCKSGTGGIVVVPSSGHRAWERAPWVVAPLGTPLLDIPDDMLDAVAAPIHPALDATLLFGCGASLKLRRCCWIRRMAYFEPFFDEEEELLFASGDRQSASVPVPTAVSIAAFEDMLQVLDHGTFAPDRDPPDAARARAVALAADMLGLDRPSVERLRADLLRQRDLAAWMPEAWRADACERRGTDRLVKLEREVPFRPMAKLPKMECWSRERKDMARLADLAKLAPRMDLTHAILSLPTHAIPEVVLDLLRAFPNLLLAGSAAAWVVSRLLEPPSDWDLFVWGVDEAGASEIMRGMIERTKDEFKIGKTGRAVTFSRGEYDYAMIPFAKMSIQLVLRLYESPHQILGSFDLAPCKVGVRWDPEAEALEFLACPTCLVALEQRTFWINTDPWSETSLLRVFKYISKGFSALLPGSRPDALDPPDLKSRMNALRRRSLGDLLPARKASDVARCPMDALSLMACDAILRERNCEDDHIYKSVLLLYTRNSRLLKRGLLSDYMWLVSLQKRIAHVLAAYAMRIANAVQAIFHFRNNRSVTPSSTTEASYFFAHLKKCDPASVDAFVSLSLWARCSVSSVFHPSEPGLLRAHDKQKWDQCFDASLGIL